jgi:hypothetical protein
MYPTPSKCPVCGETLTVTRLHCPSCDTSVEGRFEYSRLERLSSDQRAFVEMFVRLDGKLNWVAQELKVSYHRPQPAGRRDPGDGARGTPGAASRGKGARGGTAPGDPGRPGRGQAQPG